jgi:protein ImuB
MLKRAPLAASQAQLQLFSATNDDSVCSSVAPAARAAPTDKLWVCIWFPALCLEALASPRNCAAVAVSEARGVATVCAVNDSASAAGINPSMSLQTALALCPALDVRQRREAAEQALLRAKANWALTYTPVVSISPAGALLLEVRGSLRLFAGLPALRARLSDELQGCGHKVVLASAPVAKAALWLARSGLQQDCTVLARLPALLADLPLACLDWPVRVQRQLLQMGVSLLGDCARLPRAGFARRIGVGYLQELDQAYGRQPELQHFYQAAEQFSDSIELPAESLVAAEISRVLQELLSRLVAFLVQRQAHTRRLQVQFAHLGRAPTQLELVVRESGAVAEHFMELLSLQLERQTLPAPVCEVSLRAGIAPDYEPGYGDLLHAEARVQGGAPPDRVATDRLIERLRARLGVAGVYGLRLVAEHRPEHAWCIAEPWAATAGRSAQGEFVSRPRPLWLLNRPQRLSAQSLAHLRHAKARAHSSAERIESGWWDGTDIRRDYYRVADQQGKQLWVYRDGRSSDWYLHGLFA